MTEQDKVPDHPEAIHRMKFPARFQASFQLAKDWYGDRKRIGSNEPNSYFNHILRVVFRVCSSYYRKSNCHPCKELIDMAFMHDIIEADVGVTIDMVREKCGDEVADGVLVLTPPKDDPEKEKYRKQISDCNNPWVHIIKMADIIDNTTDIRNNIPDITAVPKWAEQQLVMWREAIDPRWDDDLYEELRVVLDKFWAETMAYERGVSNGVCQEQGRAKEYVNV